jgi:hypothetical protein
MIFKINAKIMLYKYEWKGVNKTVEYKIIF